MPGSGSETWVLGPAAPTNRWCNLQQVKWWAWNRWPLNFPPWKKSYDKPRQCIKKQKYHFANQSLYSQSYGFSSSQVWMWELDHKEDWMPKNWCLQTGAEEDSWECLGQQGDQTSQSKRKSTLKIHWKDWCWSWSSNTLATWCEELTHGKYPDSGKDWGQEKGATEDEIIGWHHWLNGHEFEYTMGDSEGKEPWRTTVHGVAESWTRLNNKIFLQFWYSISQ